MDFRAVSDGLSVSPQIAPGEMAEVAAAGFRSIICNRPDGESPDQPQFAEVSKAADDMGVEARYVPVVSGAISDADVAAFADALADLPAPVLAYCRSGTRSAMLWAFSEA